MEYLNKTKNHYLQAGYSLVELILAIGLFGILVTILFTGFITSTEGRPQQEHRFIATSLFQETVEALRIVREQGWDMVKTNGIYYPAQTATSWELLPGLETIDPDINLTRFLEIDDVYRDENGNIVTSGGSLDLSTKKVTITIAWDVPLVSSYSSSIYLTRYLDNLADEDSTQEDFDDPDADPNNVITTLTDDGEVVLGNLEGTGRGNWCNPGTSAVSTLDLPRNGSARAITAIEGKVFSGTGENASGVSLAYVTVTDTIPPVTALEGTFDGYKTNDVFGTDTYGFLATDTNSSEVVIVDLSTMNKIGYYNINGPGDGDSIFVLGNVGFVTDGSDLATFDMSSVVGTDTQPTLDTIALAGTIKSIYVVGDYAYVAIDSSTNQLQIVDVSNPSSMSVTASYTVNGVNGRDVYVSPDETRAYLATGTDATKPEFFIVNIEIKSSPSTVSSYDTNGMDPQAVDMVLSGNMAIIVGTGGEEYQVVTIASENSPVRCGGFNEDTGIFDLGTVEEADGDAYAYINTGQADSELKVIEGGPGEAYSLTGTYESAPLDTGSMSAFNRLTFNATVPSQTSLQLQVSGAQKVAGSCDSATYTFVGPDGSISSYFTTSPEAIPFNNTPGGYDNPAECFKYKAYLETTNIFSTPVLEDVTLNYSP